MTTSEKLIQDCNRQIEAFQRAKTLITANAAMLDKYSSTGSVGAGNLETIYLHDPPANEVKDLCRAIGGNWTREHSSPGEISYSMRPVNDLGWHIFGAEKLPPPTALEL